MWLAWLRTVIFYAFFYGPFTIFWAIFAGLTSWMLPKAWRYPYIILTWSWFSLYAARWVLGIRWRVVGLEHLPKETVVIAANHQSAWETFFLQVLINPQSQVIKQSLLRIPFFGWTYRLVRPIAIDRTDKKSAMNQVIEQGTKVLAEGFHVLIFPEGTRRHPDQLGRFSKGAAMLAKAAKVPVLPVSLDAGRFWSASLKQPKMPGTITVTLHPLVIAVDRAALEVTNEIEQHVKSALLLSKPTDDEMSMSSVESGAR